MVFVILINIFRISGDDDIFWHLETGRYITENHVIPSTDVFGFVTSGKAWIPFEWLFDVIVYIIYHSYGMSSLILFKSLIFLLIFLLIFKLNKNFGSSSAVLTAVLMLLILGMMDRMIIKPQIISYLFTVVLLYIIINYRYYNYSIKSLYFIPVIFLIWCNMHMGVIAGLVLFGIFVLSVTAERLFYKKNINENKNLYSILLIFALSCIALLINPHTLNTYKYVYTHLNLRMLDEVFEWYSPFNKAFRGTVYFYVYLLFISAAVYTVYYGLRKKDMYLAVTSLVFALFSARSGRFSIDFMLIQSIVFLYVISNHKSISRTDNKIYLEYSSALFIFLLCLSVPADLFYKYIYPDRHFGFGIDNRDYPVKMTEFVKTNNIHKIGSRPFNSFGIGGYVIWELKVKNFIDSRNLEDDIYYIYKTINNKAVGFERLIDEFNFDYFMWHYPRLTENTRQMSTSVVSYLINNPGWKLIYWDDDSFLFVKDEEKFREIIERYEYRYVNPLYYIYQKEPLQQALKENNSGVAHEIIRKYNEDPNGIFINSMVKTFKVPIRKN